MARTRERAKGRRGGEAEHFARIPISVLESEASKTLEHAAFKILVIMAAQFRGKYNGVSAMTLSHAARFGINSRDTLYGSLRELKRRGLLIETRQGWRGVKNHFALYALGWLPITHMDGQPLAVPDDKHIHDYLEWQPTEKNSPGEREWSIPVSGNESPFSIPVSGTGSPISIPATGNTSRYLGAQLNGRGAKVRTLMDSQPHLQDGDIARATNESIEFVQQVRSAQ